MNSVVDIEVLRGLRDLAPDDADFLPQMIRLFLTTVPPELVSIRSSFQSGDAEIMGKTAHRLTSSSQNLGVRIMADLCRELEVAGHDRNLAGCAERIEKLFIEFETAKAFFEKFLKAPSFQD